MITDNEFFCENHESIWKTAEREQLYIYIDDEKDIKSQLEGCGATTTEIIKALLDCRKTYLNFCETYKYKDSCYETWDSKKKYKIEDILYLK